MDVTFLPIGPPSEDVRASVRAQIASSLNTALSGHSVTDFQLQVTAFKVLRATVINACAGAAVRLS